MKTKVLFCLTILLMTFTNFIQAQPTWTVIPGNYQYSMTVMAVVSIDGTEVSANTNTLAAFFGNECRGLTKLQSTAVSPSVNRYIAFLTIYSNSAIGEEITFQFFDESINFIHSVTTTVDFLVDDIQGSINDPIVLIALPANDNTTPTVRTGFESRVKSIQSTAMTIDKGLTVAELLESLYPPKDPGGNVVGSLKVVDASDQLVISTELVTDQMKVKSIAQNGDFKNYSLIPGSSDATLSHLTLSAGTLMPVFNSAVSSYSVVLPFGDLVSTVTGTLSDANANMITVQATTVPGSATITVTSEDLQNIKTYTVTFNATPNNEEDILRALYASTNGGAWTNKINWLVGNYANWFGIDAPVDKVTKINLKFNNLDGTIPSSIGGLTELKFLHLRGNKLNGTIPEEIGNLSKLTFLAISENDLGGDLPDGMSSLVKLKEIYAEKCNFTGLPDLSQMPNLDYFYVNNNLLDFGDLEPVAELDIFDFSYAPQGDIGIEENLSVPDGGLFTYTLTTGGTHNKYQWYRNGSKISGATAATISIANVQASNAGDYTCEVTNSKLPKLTLTSKAVHLVVGGGSGNWNTETWVLDVVSVINEMKNRIVWVGDPTGWSKMKVYKEGYIKDDYTFIGEVDLTAGGTEFVYTDNTSQPLVHSDYYKISFVSLTGEETALSNFQRTVHLSINQGLSTNHNLIWNAYEGLEVSHYEVLHGASSDLSTMTSLAMLPSTTNMYTHVNESPYYVIVVHFASQPGQKSGQELKSHSNKLSNDGQLWFVPEQTVKVYPNPFSETATIEFSNPEGLEYTLLVKDITGRNYLRQDQITSEQVKINKENLPPGYYIIQIIGKKNGSKLVIIR